MVILLIMTGYILIYGEVRIRNLRLIVLSTATEYVNSTVTKT